MYNFIPTRYYKNNNLYNLTVQCKFIIYFTFVFQYILTF